MKTLKVPDLARAIVARRAWRFGAGEPLLRSLGHDRRWPAREPLAAVCYVLPSRLDSRWADFQPHLAPQRGCVCGICGVQEADELDGFLQARTHRWWWAAPVRAEVTGEVSLWGKVIEHDGGYRAELAYPHRVVVPAVFRSYVEEPGSRLIRQIFAAEAALLIAEAYGIEAVVA